MIARSIAACLLLAVAVRLSAEQPTTLPPPPPAADQPGATATWSPGHWLWTGSQWSWSPGSWQIAAAPIRAAGPRWIDGQWMAGAGGAVWVPGHYQGGGDAGGAGAASASVDVVDYASSAPPPVYAVQTAEPTVYVDAPVYVDRPVYRESVYCAPVCAPPAVVVGVHVGGPLCLPAPPLFAAGGHHGFSLPRLPLPFFDPLFFLHHHR